MELRLNAFLPRTEVEGPGVRAALWVQGCPIRCPGCAVPWTWPEEGGFVASVDDITERILSSSGIEGVTFLGGEPFVQAQALAIVGRATRAQGLSVMTFSGYTLEALRRFRAPGIQELLEVTDILVDGPFIEKEKNFSRPWAGSANQRFHFLSPRYRHLEGKLSDFANGIEVRLLANGAVFINGMMTKEELDALRLPLGGP